MSLRTFFRLFTHIQMLPVLESGEETLVGGQAVMEGVMMRAPHSYCVAVRKPNGEIVTEEMPLPRMSEQYPIFKYPIFRGVGTLFQAMKLGIKALRFSANASLDDRRRRRDKSRKELSSWAMTLNLIFSLAFFIFLYKFVPLYLVTALQKWYPGTAAAASRSTWRTASSAWPSSCCFLYGVSRMKDIRRVFEYHGAEHKVVFNFESGKPVTVENAQRLHHLSPALRHQFPAGGDAHFDGGLHADSVRRLRCRSSSRAWRCCR